MATVEVEVEVETERRDAAEADTREGMARDSVEDMREAVRALRVEEGGRVYMLPKP